VTQLTVDLDTDRTESDWDLEQLLDEQLASGSDAAMTKRKEETRLYD
jgi:hypothetical protein